MNFFPSIGLVKNILAQQSKKDRKAIRSVKKDDLNAL